MRFKTFITEDKVDHILDKQGPKLLAAYKADKGAGKPEDLDAEGALRHLAGMAGKLSLKHLQWLTNRYLAGDFSLEDGGRVGAALTTYEKAQPRLGKTLDSIASFSELEDVLAKLTPEDLKSNRDIDQEKKAKLITDGNAKVFYDKGGVKVIIPKTEAASCFFGRGTKWCTAADKDNMFSRYSGPLYILLTADGRKYQLHFGQGSVQANDEKDQPIKGWDKLTQKYPALYDAFAAQAKKSGFFPLIKDVTDADLMAGFKKKNYLETIAYADSMARVLPDDVMPILQKANLSSYVTRYPRAFSKKVAFEYLKQKPDQAITWLREIGEVSRADFDELLKLVVEHLRYHSYVTAFVDTLVGHVNAEYGDNALDLQKRYKPWVMDQPLEVKKQLVEKSDLELLKVFEDDLPEAYKIELLQKDPERLKKFARPTAKMREHARWATEKLKRERRGF